MKIIVPMAGMGKRMRPHTLTVPKPLIPIAGKPIVYRLVEDIAKVCPEPIEEVAFVVGSFGKEVEDRLIDVAASVGAKGSIYYQNEPLGTAHAVLCAEEALSGKVIVAFADTLFRADFTLDTGEEGIIWVQQVPDPSAFGVVTVNDQQIITGFVEKPKQHISDLAIIGIYYFKDGDNLRNELQYLVDHDVRRGTEYQLTDALENMKNKGVAFKTGQVTEWLDCGNKNATVATNRRYLDYLQHQDLVDSSAVVENSVIVPPVYVGAGAVLRNSVIGPHVSVGKGTRISQSVVVNSIIQENSLLRSVNLSNSMIGNFVEFQGNSSDLSIGDYALLRGSTD
ncbi:glucose-1-phosphate thymidylyltransferase [Catalinimonas alkaloidigena]|uniref:Glucose-1-phosphate thymidylyltransferase n=1 Tax=Catalinimonas alkaloidigena TaxID=1075417 RepID=A0A1G9DW02_9BACT|nr:sugar phosphate nucleotidyltransferase [Catalinimonas alkaloidigena]SDK68055.1 glucose-1-phosphate thymidylyltransferase [Catalinimonas alkaloidigena]